MGKRDKKSDVESKKKKKPYFDKNKILSVWIPASLYDWFQGYLQKKTYYVTSDYLLNRQSKN